MRSAHGLGLHLNSVDAVPGHGLGDDVLEALVVIVVVVVVLVDLSDHLPRLLKLIDAALSVLVDHLLIVHVGKEV